MDFMDGCFQYGSAWSVDGLERSSKVASFGVEANDLNSPFYAAAFGGGPCGLRVILHGLEAESNRARNGA